MEEVGSSAKVRLAEKVVLMLLAVEASVVKEGSWFLLLRRVPSKRVLSRRVPSWGAVKAGSGSCHQGWCRRGGFWVMLLRRGGFLKQIKGVSTSLRVQILFMAAVAGKAIAGARTSGFAPYPVGRPGLGSLYAL